MDQSTKELLQTYFKENLYASLATVNSDDSKQPHAATISYVNDGINLYFLSSNKSQKFLNIKTNPHIAVTIDKEEPDWMKITGVQIEGIAEVVPESQAPAVFALYSEKFPIVKNFPANPEYCFTKIISKKMWLIDYRKGFGHRNFIKL